MHAALCDDSFVRLPLIVASVLVASLFASTAGAECINPALSDSKTWATLVFSGIAGLPDVSNTATFDIETVWKGKTRRRVAVRVIGGLDAPRIVEGTRYLVFARRTVTDGGEVVYEMSSCATMTLDRAQNLGWLRELGRGHPPK